MVRKSHAKFKYAEEGMIPDDWKIKQLKEIAQYITDRVDIKEILLDKYISTENMVSGKRGVVSAKTKPSTGKVTRFIKGDILLSNIRPYFEKELKKIIDQSILGSISLKFKWPININRHPGWGAIKNLILILSM
ncbi:MAG: hypothetical protein QXU18_09000 [Thermoplasmatales archaeon]